jgi:hypothetical protein
LKAVQVEADEFLESLERTFSLPIRWYYWQLKAVQVGADGFVESPEGTPTLPILCYYQQ